MASEDILSPDSANKPREGWDDAFHDMAQHADDSLLDDPTPTEWDNEEWDW